MNDHDTGVNARFVIAPLLLMVLFIGGATAQNAGPAPEAGAPDMSALARLVPEGQPSQDVRLPSFANGRLRSVIDAETVTRLDDERLGTGPMVLQFFAVRREENVRVDLKSSTYHLTEKILRSGERSKISRSDLEVQGDTLVYDTSSSLGRLKGRVRAIVFDTGLLSGKSAPAAPGTHNVPSSK